MMNEDTDEHQLKQEHKPVVIGIGASAGGLAALKVFFDHVPENSGASYVVVMHLSPDHESHLAELLQPHVKMPVQQVVETTSLDPNRVYVIPPGSNLSAIDSHLRLSDLESRRLERAPIDHFFRTLAQTHDGQSVGVILTGTGSDGALGIKEIKGRAGLTIVQDPNEAEYDGMPQSAVATGFVDLVLPLAEIPHAALQFGRTQPKIAVPREDEEDVDAELRRVLQKIFVQVHARTGRDFGRYKRSTILRRIARRMQMRHVEQLSDYLQILSDSPEEVLALSDELLITVTNFFRDPEVFERLETEVIPRIMQNKDPQSSMRVWSVGCATGEEAYSVAMLLLEAADKLDVAPRIQVFASDLHERSLSLAREGFYPGDIETDVSAQRLNRFFKKEGGGYRIRQEVREQVVFAPHNLMGDPPFSRLDLVTCRNVLIYLQRDVQRDIIELFHYALVPNGFLVLGTSESIDAADLFLPRYKKECIFQKRNVPAPEPRLPVFPLTRTRVSVDAGSIDPEEQPVAHGLLHQRMVERYSLPSLLISPDDRVVHLSEHAGRYLVHPGGEMTTNVFKVVAEELHIELRAILHIARHQGRPEQSKLITMQIDGKPCRVMMHVHPALQDDQKGFVLVIFDERAMESSGEAGDREGSASESAAHQSDIQLREAQTELQLTRHRLQGIIEEYETSQEEMRASNEELESANEELRSTMEELETSKEELQSMNEELQTVNQENHHKVEQLAQLSSDLQNLLTATDIATLFLDRKLRILRFTPKVGELFNVRLVDRGRSLFDFTHRLGYDELPTDAQRVLEHLAPIEREIQDDQGHWYLTRVLPYRSNEDRIEGIVITFVDITANKRTEVALRESEERYRLLIENAMEYAIILFDLEGRISLWNRGAARITGFSEQDAIGRSGDIIFTPEDQAAGVFRQELETALQDEHANDDRWQQRKDGSRFWANGVTMALRHADGSPRGFAKVLRDITDQKQAAESLREAEWRLRQALEAAELGTWSYDPETDQIQLDSRARAIFGVDRDTISGDDLHGLLHSDHVTRFIQAGEAALHPSGDETFDETHRVVRPDGEVRWVRGYARIFFEGEDDQRQAVRAVGVVDDITAEIESENALRGSETRLRLAAEANGFGSYETHLPTMQCVWSREMFSILGIDEAAEPSQQVILDATLEEDRQRVVECMARCTSPGGSPHHAVEFRIARPDGEIRWLRDIGDTFFEQQGDDRRAARIVGMVQDVTEQKNFERSLEEARGKAEAANRARGEFLANMSHEIRTPMSAILGYADVMLERVTDPDDRNSLQIIRRNGEHLLKLINDILDLSRIEAGKLEIAEEFCELPRLVSDVRSLLQVRADEKDLPLHIRSDGPVPQRIQTDPTRLRQILFNLLGNAIKFTHEGEVCLTVELIQESEQPMIQFAVEDTGIGMTEQQQARLFKPFSQGDPSVTRSYGGSGLGLAISQRLVTMLHGELTFRSAAGEGSTFTVRLPTGPLEGIPLVELTLDDQPAVEEEPVPQNHRLDARVLVVDDRRDVRHISRHFLERAGATVVTAEDGQHGIDAARQAAQSDEAFDVILMDMQMPNLDGMQAVAQLRGEGYELPIIALTADAMKGDRERCLAGGFDDYLSKPIDHIQLVSLVGKYAQDLSLDELRAQREAQKQDSPA